MSHPNQESPRYHALDAMRASAMLLGIVFHAAWMYTPAQYGAPVIDSGANHWMWFLVFWTHQFRMQAFFLIAGFFAAMVFHRRGWRVFAGQRLRRIGIPLALGWLVCFPLIAYFYNWGAVATGSSLWGASAWTLTRSQFDSWTVFKVRYGLTHLWFLYVLLLLYTVTIGGEMVLRVFFKDSNGRRSLWADAAARFLKSPWSILALTLATAAVNLPANWNVEPTPAKLIPPVSSFLTFWIFFLVGWLTHGRPALLELADLRWKHYLTAGTLVSAAMFFGTVEIYKRGQLTNVDVFPIVDQSEVLDWNRFRQDLLARKESGQDVFAARVWEVFSPSARQLAVATNELTLNHLAAGLKGDELRFGSETSGLLRKPAAERSPEEVRLLNRLLLEKSFPETIAASTLSDSRFIWGCRANLVLYCLVSWLLTFGFLGFFRRYFSHPHEVWRYLADSAYWMYIVHLPLLFVLEIPIATLQVPWVLKFALLNIVAFGILLASYHFLVRSTIVGETLNGRRYKFVNPFQVAG
jgi:peptidoglycan/LPS O-acetylase OafA/YrhL